MQKVYFYFTLLTFRIMQKVFVIILNFRGKEDTKECVLSVLASSYVNYEIVIVDNYSKDDSSLYLKTTFPNIVLIETESNLGYAGGNNVGIRYAIEHGADSILILNNDTILDKDCITHFVSESEMRKKSVLGGRVYYHDRPNLMQHFGGMWEKKKGKFRNVPDKNFNSDLPHNLDFVTGCALFVPRKIFEEVGLFEESFFLYYEEIDWCLQVRKKGFFCTYVPSPILWHKESRSFTHPKPPQSYFQWRNRIYFIKRNFPKSEFYLWMLLHLPRRILLLIIKKYSNSLSSLFFGDSYKKRISRLSYRASLKGIYDYFRGSFGPGPPWIFSP